MLSTNYPRQHCSQWPDNLTYPNNTKSQLCKKKRANFTCCFLWPFGPLLSYHPPSSNLTPPKCLSGTSPLCRSTQEWPFKFMTGSKSKNVSHSWVEMWADENSRSWVRTLTLTELKRTMTNKEFDAVQNCCFSLPHWTRDKFMVKSWHRNTPLHACCHVN